MTKKSYVVALVIILILAVIPGIYLLKRSGVEANLPEANPGKPTLVDVDAIAKHPESFIGTVGVTGKVIKVDEPNTTFALGCEDACLVMPVIYSGDMPDLGSQVIVYGEVKEAEGGKYVFQGKDIKLQ